MKVGVSFIPIQPKKYWAWLVQTSHSYTTHTHIYFFLHYYTYTPLSSEYGCQYLQLSAAVSEPVTSRSSGEHANLNDTTAAQIKSLKHATIL